MLGAPFAGKIVDYVDVNTVDVVSISLSMLLINHAIVNYAMYDNVDKVSDACNIRYAGDRCFSGERGDASSIERCAEPQES